MLNPTEPEDSESQPIHFVGALEPEDIEEQVERRPMVPLIILIALIIGGGALLSRGAETDPSPSTTTPTSSPTTPAPSGVNATVPGSEPVPDPIEFPAVDTPIVGLVASRPPDGRFWRIDLRRGVAVPLAGPDLDEPFRSVRVFGPERAIGLLDEGRLALLRVEGDRVLVDLVADVGARTFLGLDFVADDGRSAWIRTSVVNSLLRWDLVTGETLGRWVDLDGDIEDPPAPVGIINGDDLVVRAGVETFVIDDDSIANIAVVGTPEAAAGSWVLSSSCADDLRCGQLHLLETSGGARLELDELAQFTSVCGTITPAPDGGVGIVARRLAVASLLRLDGDPLDPVALHIANWGCVDLHGFALDQGTAWVSSSLRGVAVVDPDGQVTLVPLEAVGGLAATGWGPAG